MANVGALDVRSAMLKWKRLRGKLGRAWGLSHNDGDHGPLVTGEGRSLDDTSPVSGAVHAGFCERRGAETPKLLNQLARASAHE